MSRSICLVLGLFLVTPGSAQEFISDAWGLADPTDTTRAGWAGFRNTSDGQSEIVAPSDASDVLFFVGQKSVVAGSGQGQAAALILDRLGNLVIDGTPAKITLGPEIKPTFSENGIAAVKFTAGTQAGHYHAGATVGRAQSLRAEYEVIPDLLSIKPSLLPDSQSGQVEAFHDFATQSLVDQFDNIVVGGTGTMTVLQADDGSTTILPGQTTGGVANGRLLARDLGQERGLSGQLFAIIGVHASNPVPYRILPLQAAAPLRVRSEWLEDLALLRMTIGPFLTDAGHLLNDGAPVQAELLLSDGRNLWQDAWLMDGNVVIDWLAPKGTKAQSLTVISPLGNQTLVLSAAIEGLP